MPNAETPQEKSSVRINIARKSLKDSIEWAQFAFEINPCHETKAVVTCLETALADLDALHKLVFP